MNLSLLCKWWWKLKNETGLWQEIVKLKYLKNKGVSTVNHRLDDSPMWSDLIKVRNLYLRGRVIKVRDGKQTLFWKDIWLQDKPLCVLAPVLFDWCSHKDVTVHQFLSLNGHLSFDRWLPPILFEQWLSIVGRTFCFQFQNERDICWKWGGKGQYTSKSMYDLLTKDDVRNSYKHIWKAKIPYKIKMFTYLIENNAIPTKDNMKKRKWEGDPRCVFCDQMESTKHLFFNALLPGVFGDCVPGDPEQYRQWIRNVLPQGEKIHQFGYAAICWAIWKCRNRAVFYKKVIKHPAEIIVHACVFMSHWAGLFNVHFANGIIDGVKVMLVLAYKILAQQRRGACGAAVACSR
jgi:hypothetical protein